MDPAEGKVQKKSTGCSLVDVSRNRKNLEKNNSGAVLPGFCLRKIKSKMSSAPSARTLSVQRGKCCACGQSRGDKPLRDVDWQVVLPLKYFPTKICRHCDEKNISKIQVFSASRHGFCDDARASLGTVFLAATRAIDE